VGPTRRRRGLVGLLEHALALFEREPGGHEPKSHGVGGGAVGAPRQLPVTKRVPDASHLSPWSIRARLRGRLLGELGLGGTVIGVGGATLLPE
jgi:hypothetical protein